jgi:hypothetical protein
MIMQSEALKYPCTCLNGGDGLVFNDIFRCTDSGYTLSQYKLTRPIRHQDTTCGSHGFHVGQHWPGLSLLLVLLFYI